MSYELQTRPKYAASSLGGTYSDHEAHDVSIE